MTKPSSTIFDQCSASQLRDLLGLAAAPAVKQSWIASRVASPTQVAVLLSELCSEEKGSGDALLDLVVEPNTPVDTLRGVKELAKDFLGKAPSERHGSAAKLLYHAAIAAALASHGINISGRPLAPRARLYDDMASGLTGSPLGALFRKAADRALGQSSHPVTGPSSRNGG